MPVSTSASRTLAAIAIEVDRARTEVWALVDGRVVGEVLGVSESVTTSPASEAHGDRSRRGARTLQSAPRSGERGQRDAGLGDHLWNCEASADGVFSEELGDWEVGP